MPWRIINANIRESADEGTNDNEPLIKQLNEIMNEGKEDAEGTSEEAEASAQPAAEAGGSKWLDIKLGDSERTVLKEAVKQGKGVYGITVTIQESCILKAARAFLVFKAIEEDGEIIVSDPTKQEIEDEKFGLDFSLIVVSDSTLEKVLEAAKNVSEIKDATGDVVDPDKETPAAEQKEEPAQKQEEEQPAASAAAPVPAAPAAPAKSAKKADEKKPAASKPVVNRTVRVDIEKLDTLMNLVSELIIAKNSLVSASAVSGTSSTAVNEQIEYLESVTTSLHE